MSLPSRFLIHLVAATHMKHDITEPARLAAILFAGLCIPLPAQNEKQPPVETTEIVELSVSGMT